MRNNLVRCWERAREKNLVMETTEQFWWKTRARGETTPGVRGREHPFGLREERTKKTSTTDIFGRKLEGRRVREGSRSRGRREESSSSCTPASTCRSSKEEQEGVHRRACRRKESGKQGEESRSEEGKIRGVAQMKEGEEEKRKELEEEMVRRKEVEEEEKIMAQAHSLLLSMDSMLSLEGTTLLHVYQLKPKISPLLEN